MTSSAHTHIYIYFYICVVRALKPQNTYKWRPGANKNNFKTKGYAVIGLYLKKILQR